MFAILRNKKGFLAITEVAIVLSVIAILAAIGIPTFRGAQERARRTRAISDMGNILAPACALHKLDTGVYPSSITQLYSNISSLANWRGPYTSGRLTPALDSWKKLYTIQAPTGITALIHSAGRDGIANSSCLDFNNINRQTGACTISGADDLGVYLE